MKTTILRKSIFALVIMFACGLFASAASPRNYLYDTKEVDGKIVSKVVFLNEEGLLNKEVKYEFSYNETGKVSEKKAYRWNKAYRDWETDRKSTRLNSSHRSLSRMPSSA